MYMYTRNGFELPLKGIQNFDDAAIYRLQQLLAKAEKWRPFMKTT